MGALQVFPWDVKISLAQLEKEWFEFEGAIPTIV